MVAIDGPFSGEDRGRAASELPAKLGTALRRAARVPLLLVRRTDAERAARAQRIAEQVSQAAGRPTVTAAQEPARLAPQAMSHRLSR
ncbi:MAG: hypothetical protein AAGJ70_09885 [Pseudomonadota bacterium]